MAIKTMQQKVLDAREEYETRTKNLGTDVRNAIVCSLAPAIPDGWVLIWSQSDNQYDDNNYHFGLNTMYLVSEREPRPGKPIEPARTSWTGYERGRPAVYEWILDESCSPRDLPNYRHDTGVIALEDDGVAYGLTEQAQESLLAATRAVTDDMWRSAFGSDATIMIKRDGTCVINGREN